MQRAGGKTNLFNSPSQKRVPYFPSQEGRQEYFTGNTFLPDKKRGDKRAHDWPHAAEDERKFPRKSRKEKSYINFYNFYLFYHLFRYFMFARREVSSEQIFQKNSCLDCSRRVDHVDRYLSHPNGYCGDWQSNIPPMLGLLAPFVNLYYFRL